jgi:hypothetical protein
MEPTTSLRDQIEAAIETTPPDVPEAAPAPAAADSAPAPVEASEPAEAPAQDEPAAAGQDLNALAEGEAEPERQEKPQPERDESGKFKAKEEGIQPGPKSGPRQAGERAPASWRPDVREHWGQLPEPVRAEIHRREVEVQRTLQESAEARKNYDAVMRTVAPYEAFIRAEGSNPIQAIDNLMATAAKLRTGTAPELAQMVAGIVNQFGVGRFGNGFIQALDAALVGETPAADPQAAAVEQVINQRLAPVQQMLTQFQQAQIAQQERAAQEAKREIDEFLERAEFGNDVAAEMADLMETAARRGQDLSLAEAYKRACLMNDRVLSVLRARKQSQGAQVQTQAAQRAKAAAVSVSGAAPKGALQQPATDVRSAIEAAIVQSAR